MRQDILYCYNHPDEYPFNVQYYTEKQPNWKLRYFKTIEDVKKWCRTHKQARITYASWEVFSIMEGKLNDF